MCTLSQNVRRSHFNLNSEFYFHSKCIVFAQFHSFKDAFFRQKKDRSNKQSQSQHQSFLNTSTYFKLFLIKDKCTIPIENQCEQKFCTTR